MLVISAVVPEEPYKMMWHSIKAAVGPICGHLSQASEDIPSQFIEEKSNNAFHFISSHKPLWVSREAHLGQGRSAQLQI